MLDRIRGDRQKPVGVPLAAEVCSPHPGRIGVGGLHANPVADLLAHPQRLAGQRLRDLLGVVGGFRAKGRELARERMFA